MTDQLEHDLRAMLAARATAVTADPSPSEDAIADRLRSSDAALADIVPFPARTQPRRWLIAAAAAVAAVVVGLTVVVLQDDPEVRTIPVDELPTAGDPVIFTAPGSAEEVVRAYLEDRLDAAADAVELSPTDTGGAADAAGYDWTRTDTDQPTGGFVGLVQRDGRWAVLEAFSDGPSIDSIERDAGRVTVRTTAPAGSYVQLGIHLLTGDAITSGGCGGDVVGAGTADEAADPVRCDLLDEPIAAAGDDPVTVRFSVVTQEGVLLTLEEQLLFEASTPAPGDPTIGAPGDAAKDVAERVALAVLGAA